MHLALDLFFFHFLTLPRMNSRLSLEMRLLRGFSMISQPFSLKQCRGAVQFIVIIVVRPLPPIAPSPGI